MASMLSRRAQVLSGRSEARPVRLAHTRASPRSARLVSANAMKGLIFDCDGVVLESEELHRKAYNAAFSHFDVQCDGELVDWSQQLHAAMESTVGLGFKLKLKYYFDKKGWPTSKVAELQGKAPQSEAEQALLIEALQAWKNSKYQEMISNGEAEPRPGVLRLMDEAKEAGMKLGVCSAATKSTVEFTLKSLLGVGRFEGLDCFLAGDDIAVKKPDPSIYTAAAEKLGLKPDECVVIEDSSIGLRAARDAGMRCVITYTRSTKDEAFPGAERIIHELGSYPALVTVKELQERRIVQDDRIEMSMTDGAVFWHIPGQ